MLENVKKQVKATDENMATTLHRSASGKVYRVRTVTRPVTIKQLEAEDDEDYRESGFNPDKLRAKGIDFDEVSPDDLNPEDFR